MRIPGNVNGIFGLSTLLAGVEISSLSIYLPHGCETCALAFSNCASGSVNRGTAT